jgi:FKBP-type peptidyl-prolyl cis-trans isomerase FkpA/FKBP-type peptidyl-prolyl cis-trans isomerase FklB
MKRIHVPFLLLLLLTSATVRAADPSLDTDDRKTLYALGHTMARGLGSLGLTEAEMDVVKAGLTDGVLGRDAKVPIETYGPKIQEFAKTRMTAAAEVEKKASKEFLEKAAKEKGAKKTDSGLIFKELAAGKGEKPSPTSTVKVHYHGTLRDGTVFDSSVERQKPATFALNQVIPCWTEGLQKMSAGGKSKLVCPSDLAYKDRGAPPLIKPGAALVFEVELLEIEKK